MRYVREVETRTGGAKTERLTSFDGLAQALGVADDFGNDPDTTSGLTYGIKSGRINFDANSDQNIYAAGTVTLFDDTINALYLCPDLGSTIADAVVVVDTHLPQPSLPVSNFVVAHITTAGGQITNIDDVRCVATTAYLTRGGLCDLSYIKAEDNGDGTFTVTLKSGAILPTTGIPVDATGRFVIVDDDATNYIEIAQNGAISSNTSGFTPGRLPLYTVEIASAAIANVTDYRCFLYAPSGASGSFTSQDGKTVTVVNGVITAIA